MQSLDPLYARIGNSLLLYLTLFLFSICLLALFCWYFTGRLLQPLLASQESQNRFIAGVSHELRTPLAVILSNASACEKAPPAEQKGFFQVIAREGAQMSDMLEQLLTLSRADSHALSYTPAGSAVLFFIAEGSYEKEITIGVQDDGPGIPDEEKEKIFDRFYRVKSNSCAAKDEKGHHGLGLAVAREIVAAHGGTLTAADAAGGGAVFLITLPMTCKNMYLQTASKKTHTERQDKKEAPLKD